MIKFLILLTSLLSIPVSSADDNSARCRFYLGDELNIPDDVRGILEITSGAAAKVCNIPRTTLKDSYLVSEVKQETRGVCFYSTSTVFENSSKSGSKIIWNLLPPAGEEYRVTRGFSMFEATDSSCPRQDDERYILADGVSGGVFLGLTRSFERAMSDEKSFEMAFDKVPLTTKSSIPYQELKMLAKGRRGAQLEVKISSISLAPIDTEMGPHYLLIVDNENPLDDILAWLIAVDIDDQGFYVLEVGIIPKGLAE